MNARFRERVPGAAGELHARFEPGHFLQETAAPELARRIHDLIVTDGGFCVKSASCLHQGRHHR
jgi:hypothetical protein